MFKNIKINISLFFLFSVCNAAHFKDYLAMRQIIQHPPGSYLICSSPGNPTLRPNENKDLQTLFNQTSPEVNSPHLTDSVFISPIGPVKVLETPEPFSKPNSPFKSSLVAKSTENNSVKTFSKKTMLHALGNGHTGLLLACQKKRNHFKAKQKPILSHTCRSGDKAIPFEELDQGIVTNNQNTRD